MSSFFDNFMGGLAFGMLASNPFFRGMGGFGFGGGCCSGFGIGFGFGGINSTYYSGFANPFPSIFGGYMGGYSSSAAGLIMPEGFANNNFPQIDFETPSKTIWDAFTNPDSNYNKSMRDWYESMNKRNSNINKKDSKSSVEKTEDSSKKAEENKNTIRETKNEEVKVDKKVKVNNKVKIKAETRTEAKTEAQKSDKQSNVADNQKLSQQVNNSEVISYDISDLKNKWSKKKNLPDAFYQKVISISKKIKCNPDDLMGVMWVESAHTFSPSARNKGSGATGLIQFMPSTAKILGTTVNDLRKMTSVQQLEYVEKCLVMSKKLAGYNDDAQIDRGTLYSLVFLPARSKRQVLTSVGEKYYSQNKVLDSNKDGSITKQDLAVTVGKHMDMA